MAENAKKTKAVSITKKICVSLWYISVVLLFLLLVSIFISKMSGKVPNIFGFSIVRIISPSMEDEIPTGSYILLKKTDAEDIVKGDVICFYSSDPQILGMPNTHRVVEPPIVTENGIEFVTRGDANLRNDNYTASADRLIGKYVCKLKLISKVAGFAEGRGIYALSMVLVFGAFVIIILSYKKTAKAEKQNAARGEKDESPTQKQ